MAISNSQIVEDRAQVDGRRHVRERHTDHLGVAFDVTYMAESGANVNTAMSGRVASIEAMLRDAEIAKNFGLLVLGQNGFTLDHSTATENATYLRAQYLNSKGWDAIVIGRGIHVQNWTNTRFQNLFGVSGATLTALKTKLANQAAKYDAAITEVGE